MTVYYLVVEEKGLGSYSFQLSGYGDFLKENFHICEFFGERTF